MGAYFEQLRLPKNQQITPYLFNLEDSEEKRIQMFGRWLRKNRPDAILTDTADLLTMLNELKIRVPEEVGLATTSITDTSSIDAGINQHPEEIGRAAVRMLCALINEHSFGIPTVRNETLIEGRWVDGSMMPPRTL